MSEDKRSPLDRQLLDLEAIGIKVELAKAVTDPLRRRQLLKEICWIAAEYVVAK